jgi:hypothetical protein
MLKKTLITLACVAVVALVTSILVPGMVGG